MDYILAQVLSALGGPPSCLWQEAGGLAARNNDEGDTGWVQILFFVLLSVFYALGSILKARANKAAPKGKEQTPSKPVRKPPELGIDLQMLKRLFGLPEEEPESGSQPRPQITKPQVVKPQVQPRLEKVPEFTVEAAAPAETPRAEYLSEILSDYEDPEKLRRAILHYEILGKPISLREPSEHLSFGQGISPSK